MRAEAVRVVPRLVCILGVAPALELLPSHPMLRRMRVAGSRTLVKWSAERKRIPAADEPCGRYSLFVCDEVGCPQLVVGTPAVPVGPVTEIGDELFGTR